MPTQSKLAWSPNISRHIFAQFINHPDDSERLPLTVEEQELAGTLFPIINDIVEQYVEKKVAKESEESFYQDPVLKESLELIRTNLKIIILKFSDSDVACKAFMKVFNTCEKKRVESISKLRKIAKELNKHRKNCNISQITGSAGGAIGCAVIASTIIFPPAGLILTIGGSIVAGIGAAVAIGTTGTETVLVHQNVKEAQVILKEDKEQCKTIEELFTHSIEFVAAVEAVFSIDLMKKLGESLRGLKRDNPNFIIIFRRSIFGFLEGLCRSSDINISMLVRLLPIVVTTLSVLFLLRKNNPFIFNVILLTSHLFYAFTSGLELGVEVTRIIGQIFMRGGMKAVGQMPANVARIVFHGVFAGLGMALDIINIIYSAIDLKKGSKSAQAEEIEKAANALEKELLLLRDIHNGIKDILSNTFHSELTVIKK